MVNVVGELMYHVVANRLTCYSEMSAHCYVNVYITHQHVYSEQSYTFYQLQNIKSV